MTDIDSTRVREPANVPPWDDPGTEDQLNAIEALAMVMFSALPAFGWVAPRPWDKLDERQRSHWRHRAEQWIASQSVAPGSGIGGSDLETQDDNPDYDLAVAPSGVGGTET